MLRRGGLTSRFYLAILQSGTRRALQGVFTHGYGRSLAGLRSEQGGREDNAPVLAFASMIRKSDCTACAIADGDLHIN